MDEPNVIKTYGKLWCTAREGRAVLTSASTCINLEDKKLSTGSQHKAKLSHSHEKLDCENLERKKVE